MKEFSFYLFLLLFIYVKLEDIEIPINTIDDAININYIILNDENGNPLKFLLNPRSKKVVLFNSNTPTYRNLDSNNNENEEEDYLDLFKLKIQSTEPKTKIK